MSTGGRHYRNCSGGSRATTSRSAAGCGTRGGGSGRVRRARHAGAGAATGTPLPTPVNASTDPLLKAFVWREIGPANIGGRIDDIAVVESNPSIIYVGFATGGVWKSVNNGTTWTPIFDEYPVSSIGDIAIAPSNPDILYVGTGEANNRQSSSFGAGVYKSIDGGKTFVPVGLEKTQSIARIVVHPKNPDIAYVAATGHLFGPNPERGLYKTTDGGKTWTNTKFIDNDTGFTDVVMDPSNPNTLYAASYQRRRVPWGFNGAGPGSGIWKTTNGGQELDQDDRERPADQSRHRADRPGFRAIEAPDDLRVDRGRAERRHRRRRQRRRHVAGARTARRGRRWGRGGAGRGNQPPPDPTKSGIWRSDDGGKSWRFLANSMDRPMYYSQIRVDPNNPDIAYQGGAPFFKTTDGGKSWRQVAGLAHSGPPCDLD